MNITYISALYDIYGNDRSFANVLIHNVTFLLHGLLIHTQASIS
jgi:hypothetical protein